jgi:microsomal dipeptidase-like Zn-dependent dipeptidase
VALPSLRSVLLTAGLLTGAAAIAALTWLPGAVERSQNQVVPHSSFTISDSARALHDTLEVADLHSDTLLWRRDPLERSSRGHVDLPRLREGGVALQVFAAVTKSPAGQNYESNDASSDQLTALVVLQRWPRATWSSLLERALHQATKLNDAAARGPDELLVVRTRKDLQELLARRAAGEPVVGGLLAIEGAHALEGRLENLDRLYEAGYRMLGLQHFFDNELGGSLHRREKLGLTEFGREVVRRAQAGGWIVDVAHSSPAVVDDVLALATEPVVVSHTGLAGACDSPRNLDDARLRRIAHAGGLVGVGFWKGAVCDTSPIGVVRSILHATRTLGEAHVALGSAYDGSTTVRFDSSELAVLTQELLRAGASEREVRAVMGENLLTFLDQHLP